MTSKSASCLGLRRIDQARECCDRRVHRGAGVGIGGERQRFEIACFGRQQRDLDLRRRPVAGDGKLFVPVESDPHRRLRLAREFDRRDGFHAKAGLGAEAAADMIRDHSYLVMFELVAFGDQLHQMKHRLRRDVHGQPLAIETGDGCVRLQAGVLLRAGPECPLDQQRILRLARGYPPSSGPSLPCGRMPRMARGRCVSRAPASLRLRRRCPLSSGWIFRIRPEHPASRAAFQSDHRRQGFAGDPDGGDGLDRGLSILRGDGGDGIADIADDAVVAEQRDRRDHA